MRIIKSKHQTEKERKAQNKKIIIKGFLVFLLLVSLWYYRNSLNDILEEIQKVTWAELGISILLSSLGYLLEGLTIWGMMKTVIPRATANDGIFIAFVCEFYRLTTLGNGSGVAQIHYLCKKNVEPGTAIVLTMIQYVMKRTAIMVLGIWGFLFLFRKDKTQKLCREYAVFMGVGSLITTVIITLFVCIVCSKRVAEAVLGMVGWLSVKFPAQKENFEKWKEQILLLSKSGRSVLGQKKRMLSIFFMQSIKLLAFYAIPAYLFCGKINLGTIESVWLMAVAFMLAGVIPAPSGVGALEFVFLLFFNAFTDSGMSVSVLLLYRFATWVYPAIVGGMLLLVHGLSEKRRKV